MGTVSAVCCAWSEIQQLGIKHVAQVVVDG